MAFKRYQLVGAGAKDVGYFGELPAKQATVKLFGRVHVVGEKVAPNHLPWVLLLAIGDGRQVNSYLATGTKVEAASGLACQC